MSLATEKRLIEALQSAVDGLIVAACDLGSADKIEEARAANNAAKRANEACRTACDEILNRPLVRLLAWIVNRVNSTR